MESRAACTSPLPVRPPQNESAPNRFVFHQQYEEPSAATTTKATATTSTDFFFRVWAVMVLLTGFLRRVVRGSVFHMW
ncbi:hypothetical protein ACFQ2K_34295 [Streptomyces sanglieri]|uniref:Uncharacterized protein n=1 Tax=Streptomyces sanglieri TaxID=193460 RepID=A0ABW2WZL4_9ACTN